METLNAMMRLSRGAYGHLLCLPIRRILRIGTGIAVIVTAVPVTAYGAPEIQVLKEAVTNSDPCLAFMSAVPSARDQKRDTALHKKAGAVTALGLIFGIRYATGPKEAGIYTVSRDRPFAQGTEQDNGRALAISAWRRCVNQQTIEANHAEPNAATALNKRDLSY